MQPLDLPALARLGTVFAHLLLCVFALQCVLATDWRLLRGRISARRLARAHTRIVWLLAGLWLTGLVLVGIDTGFDGAQIAARPKLVAKLLCVGLLSLNGAFLRLWCFPRLAGNQPLPNGEAAVLMASGGLSTSSWMAAAFLGIARPLQQWSALQVLVLYGAVVCCAMVGALLLRGRLQEGRRRRQARLATGMGTDPAPLGGAELPSRLLAGGAGAGQP